MEYRKLPHGVEKISVLGLGMGGIQQVSDAEIEQMIRRALAGCREKIYVHMHFGAVYNENGDYGWSLTEIAEYFK